MPIGTKRPQLTVARALLIRIMEQYASFAYRLTLLEIQKLAYFLQESGQSLRLRYETGHYGPYAANLNKVLEVLEGHFIRGYGDTQKPDVEIELMEGAAQEAGIFMAQYPDVLERIDRVEQLISGFETPYGMELLSSVHWVAIHGDPPVDNSEAAIQAIAKWSERKRRMFRPEHIRVAWRQLSSENWLPGEVDLPH